MPIRRRTLFTGLCLCCAPAARAAAAPTEIAPGLHIRPGLTADAAPGNSDAIANTGFIIGREAVAVIDPGGSLEDGTTLRRAIRQVTTLPIRYIILSHVHPDHIFGAGAFLPEKPIFVGHANLPAALAARGAYYRQALDAILGAGQAGPIVTPDLLVAHEHQLDLGSRVLRLKAHGPAHTDNDVSVLDQHTGILLAGDLLFVRRVPSLDGDLKNWLTELAAFDAAGIRQAVPGHGPAVVEYAAAVIPLRRYLTALLTETRAAIKAGVPIGQAALTVAQSERPHWALFDDYNQRNVLAAYHQLEWD